MDNFPTVTVIIPVYNAEMFLELAIESVFSQTYSSELQVIVVDDGSTDNSSSIAKNFPGVHYLHQSNKGVSAARNAGLELVKGDLIAFLDSDDIWKPEKLEEQVSYMEQHPEIGITGTYAENFLEPDTELPARIKANADWQKLEDHIIPSTMMVRASVFKEIGKFDEEMIAGEDTEWLWRAKQADIKDYTIKKILVWRRFHGGNLSWMHAEDRNKRLLWIARQTIRRKSKKR
jgi:glycosyltransferase involved in cell wall biosynthesis